MSKKNSYHEYVKKEFNGIIDCLELSDLQKQFMKTRWLDQLLWVDGRAVTFRKASIRLRMITVVGGVIIPALVTLNINTTKAKDYINWCAFFLSQTVAISAAIEQFFDNGKRSTQYRTTAEALKSEGWQFFQLSGVYQEFTSHQSAYMTFAHQVEQIILTDVQAITTIAKEQENAGKRKEEHQGQTASGWTPELDVANEEPSRHYTSQRAWQKAEEAKVSSYTEQGSFNNPRGRIQREEQMPPSRWYQSEDLTSDRQREASNFEAPRGRMPEEAQTSRWNDSSEIGADRQREASNFEAPRGRMPEEAQTSRWNDSPDLSRDRLTEVGDLTALTGRMQREEAGSLHPSHDSQEIESDRQMSREHLSAPTQTAPQETFLSRRDDPTKVSNRQNRQIEEGGITPPDRTLFPEDLPDRTQSRLEVRNDRRKEKEPLMPPGAPVERNELPRRERQDLEIRSDRRKEKELLMPPGAPIEPENSSDLTERKLDVRSEDLDEKKSLTPLGVPIDDNEEARRSQLSCLRGRESDIAIAHQDGKQPLRSSDASDERRITRKKNEPSVPEPSNTQFKH